MSVQYNTGIVTNGLVFCTDAANTKSYPGTGTAWTDLSLRKYAGTLTNGPTFSSTNNGYISFDGTNDYVTFGDNKIAEQSDKTASAWIYLTADRSVNVAGIIDKDYDVSPNYGGWGLWAGPITGGTGIWFWLQGNKDKKDTTVLSLNTWYNVAVTWNSTSKVVIFYINGSQSSTFTDATITENASNAVPFTIGTIRGADLTYGGGSSFYFPGRIACASVYNRVLTADEIKRNFNALRGRFSL